MTSLDDMTPRELVMGLMRGYHPDLRLGYSAESAALSTAQRHELPDTEARALLEFAQGFRDGMRDCIAGYTQAFHGDDPYSHGRQHGHRENPDLLYPHGYVLTTSKERTSP